MISVDTSGLEKLAREIAEMEARLRDLSPVLAGRAETLRSLVSDSFAKSVAPWGDKWEPLSVSTVARRRRGSAQPLLNTGKLSTSITTHVTPLSIRIGSGDVPGKAAAHQFGTNRAGRSHKVRIPARPYLPLLPDGKGAFDRGPAKTWHDRMVERVSQYVLTGKV